MELTCIKYNFVQLIKDVEKNYCTDMQSQIILVLCNSLGQTYQIFQCHAIQNCKLAHSVTKTNQQNR